MNKFEFKGTVSFAKGKTKQDCIRSGERKNGGGEYKLLNFTLFNKKCGYVDCTTFDPVIIENIQEGQAIELINYIPKKES
ncbi:hypothetical protein [Clostridium sp.]|uniref:hypothetical protein n=1 Tax=Clostridium sp. TaxID=1506 RepID=UPI002603F2F3|nr:hypothetical protein [Clostridium sp.]